MVEFIFNWTLVFTALKSNKYQTSPVDYLHKDFFALEALVH